MQLVSSAMTTVNTVKDTLVQQITLSLWNTAAKTDLQPLQPIQIPHSDQKTTACKPRIYHGLVNDRPHVTLVCGRKGSGKSSLVIELLRSPSGYYHKYNKIIIISATYVQQFEKSWSKISREGLEVYSVLSDQLLEYIFVESSRKEPMLIISDDMDESWRKSVNQQMVNKLITNSRHSNLSFLFLQQCVTQLPTCIRKNTDVFILFGAVSFSEVELIYKEVSTVPQKEFRRLFWKASEKQWGFLVCRVYGGKITFFDSFNKQIEVTCE